MPTSGEVVRKAIDDWTCGAGYITSIFSPDMTCGATSRTSCPKTLCSQRDARAPWLGGGRERGGQAAPRARRGAEGDAGVGGERGTTREKRGVHVCKMGP
jgi:hypothetical protein